MDIRLRHAPPSQLASRTTQSEPILMELQSSMNRAPLRLAVALLALTTSSEAGTISGKVVLRGIKDQRNAVVYIERIPGKTFSPPVRPVVLDQINLRFVPKVLPILAGTQVAFPNSDRVRHNVFSPGAAERFSLGTFSHGTTRVRSFNTPGEVTLLCNVHAEMSAVHSRGRNALLRGDRQ